MNFCLAFCVIVSLVVIHCGSVFPYHPDWSWRNVDSMMSPDLKVRMKKGISITRRKYCDCTKDDSEYPRPICGNNGVMYSSECLFDCSKLRSPDLEEAEDYAKCGPMSFKEFKLEEFRSHY